MSKKLISKQDIIQTIDTDTKKRIHASELNPGGYGGKLYDRAYMEIWGNDTINNEQTLIFSEALETIWRDHSYD
jgi:hypothetical protein